MAHVAGTRRVRMVGAEHWTDQPEQELATVEAGGDTYAVHERAAVDSARVRLVLAAGEDAAAAAREVERARRSGAAGNRLSTMEAILR